MRSKPMTYVAAAVTGAYFLGLAADRLVHATYPSTPDSWRVLAIVAVAAVALGAFGRPRGVVPKAGILFILGALLVAPPQLAAVTGAGGWIAVLVGMRRDTASRGARFEIALAGALLAVAAAVLRLTSFEFAQGIAYWTAAGGWVALAIGLISIGAKDIADGDASTLYRMLNLGAAGIGLGVALEATLDLVAHAFVPAPTAAVIAFLPEAGWQLSVVGIAYGAVAFSLLSLTQARGEAAASVC